MGFTAARVMRHAGEVVCLHIAAYLVEGAVSFFFFFFFSGLERCLTVPSSGSDSQAIASSTLANEGQLYIPCYIV